MISNRKIRNLRCWFVILAFASGVSAQIPRLDLPRGMASAKEDPGLTNRSAVVISITASGDIYLGKNLLPKSELGRSLKEHGVDADRIVYLAISGAADYSVGIEAMTKIREQGVAQFALIVDRSASPEPMLGTFQIFVPNQRRPDEDISKLKPNPLTLMAALNTNLELKLNHDTGGRRGQLCFEVVPNGLDSDPSRLKAWLECIFRYRTQQRAFRAGFESRTEIPFDQRIEKTVFVKAPRSVKYKDVINVINAVKGAGADPIGLQIDDLPE